MKSVFALPCSFCFVILRPSELSSFPSKSSPFAEGGGSASALAVAVACFFYPNRLANPVFRQILRSTRRNRKHRRSQDTQTSSDAEIHCVGVLLGTE
jgi:hypothetical protein